MRDDEGNYIISACTENIRTLINGELNRTSMSTAALSRKMGLEAHYLNGILNNKSGTNISLTNIVAILRYFNITFEELIGDKGRVTPLAETIEKDYHISKSAQLHLSGKRPLYSWNTPRSHGYNSKRYNAVLEKILFESFGVDSLSDATNDEIDQCECMVYIKLLNYLICSRDVIPLLSAIIFSESIEKSHPNDEFLAIDTKEFLIKKLIDYLDGAEDFAEGNSQRNNSILYHPW